MLYSPLNVQSNNSWYNTFYTKKWSGSVWTSCLNCKRLVLDGPGWCPQYFRSVVVHSCLFYRQKNQTEPNLKTANPLLIHHPKPSLPLISSTIHMVLQKVDEVQVSNLELYFHSQLYFPSILNFCELHLTKPWIFFPWCFTLDRKSVV